MYCRNPNSHASKVLLVELEKKLLILGGVLLAHLLEIFSNESETTEAAPDVLGVPGQRADDDGEHLIPIGAAVPDINRVVPPELVRGLNAAVRLLFECVAW